ncbi:tetratricopeptide repeat protein [Mangrovibacterium sp.]|uniref:tetratricopeptide repeat protein n=1 Tax=Mangrovibacterium sp. TaxID=1961364 RepID=UPI0035664703
MKFKLFFVLFWLSSVASAQLNINHYIRVGQTRISTGNYVGAIENFNIVIKFKPQLPEPYFLRGVAKHQLEDYRGAITDYDIALQIKPYYPDAYINRGLAHLSLHEYEDAIADYNSALELSPQNAGIYNNRGIAKLSMKDVDGAIEDYNKALEVSSNFVNAYINRSNANIVKGDLTEAIRDLNRAIIIRPHYASAYLLRGLARFELNDFAAALRDFDQTIKLDPENAYAYNNRGIVKQRLEDFQGAIMDYDLALQLNPTMPNAYYNRGIAKEVLGKSGYEEDYRIAAKLDPKLDIRRRPTEEEYYAQQQQQQQQAQNKTNAQGNSQSQSQSQSQSTAQGSAQDSKAQDEEAEKARRRFRLSLADTRNLPTQDEEIEDGRIQNKNVIIELQPIFRIASFSDNSVDYERLQYYNLALEELNKYNNYTPQMNLTNRETSDFADSFRNSILYFNEKIKANPTSENYLSRGIFKFLTAYYNDAIADFNESLKRDNKNLIAYYSRANCRVKMVELLEAVPDLSQDMTIALGDANNNHVVKKEFLNDYKEVLDDYQRCIDINPSFPFVYYNKAYILCKLGKYDEALSFFNRAIELQPDFAEAHFNRGLTRIYLDDVTGGAMDLSKAGELGIEEAYNIIKRYCN